MSATVTKRHCELAGQVDHGCGCCVPEDQQVDSIAQAIADAEARGREAGIRDAAEYVALRASRWEPGDSDGVEHEELMGTSSAILALLPKEQKL